MFVRPHGLLHDERGSWSMARVGCLIWTLFCIWVVGHHWGAVSPAVLAFLSTVEMAFVTWAAGPRMAQYLAPQISTAAAAIGQAVWKARDITQGVDPTKD